MDIRKPIAEACDNYFDPAKLWKENKALAVVTGFSYCTLITPLVMKILQECCREEPHSNSFHVSSSSQNAINDKVGQVRSDKMPSTNHKEKNLKDAAIKILNSYIELVPENSKPEDAKTIIQNEFEKLGHPLTKENIAQVSLLLDTLAMRGRQFELIKVVAEIKKSFESTPLPDKKKATSIFQKNDQAPKTSFSTIAKDIYTNREQLYVEANRDTSKLAVVIQKKFEDAGFTLKDIHENPNELALFLKSSVLRPALIQYAKQYEIQEILNAHIKYVADDIYERRYALWNEAVEKPANSNQELLVNFLSLVQREFNKESRSLSDVLTHSESAQVFKKSDRLYIALLLYIKLLNQPPQPSDFKNPDVERKEAVIRVAKQHVNEQGYVTVLGLKDFVDDENVLKGKIKRIIFEMHPDKNPNADQMRFQAANDLNELLKHDDYKDYRKIIDEKRNP